MSKGQEEVFCIGVFVNVLPVGEEYVRRFNKLFLDAIKWYGIEQTHDDKWIEQVISDKEYSLLADLKERVETGKEIPDRPLTRLLEQILTKYKGHLEELKGKLWVKKEGVDRRLQEIRQLAGELLDIKQ